MKFRLTMPCGKRVHVQVSAEVTKPLEERKFEGVFTIVTELSPIASPAYEVGRSVMFLSYALLPISP
jgi:exosome complex RNA-binding protein Rrp42 (RNase PH superfamily)